MRQKGFTLIELMVVLSVTAVLGTLGIAGFVIYNQVQVLQSATSDVVTVLNLAKSRAQSQIKPSGCIGGLNGYKVVITTPRTYTLYARCSISLDVKIEEQNKLLPASLSFELSKSFFFPIQTGGVEEDGQIVILGYGREKTITINSFGGVSVK